MTPSAAVVVFVVVTCIGAAAGVDGAWAHEPTAWQRAHAAALAQGWSQVGPAGDTATAVTLALAPGATRREIETALYSVSDPRSPQYGQHLTQAELRGLAATPVPVQRHVRAQVASLCPSCAVVASHAHGDQLTVTGPARDIEKLVGAQLLQYVHSDGRTTVASASAPTVHPTLRVAPSGTPAVELVLGTQLAVDTEGLAAARRAAVPATDEPWPMTGMAAQGGLYFIVLPRCENGTLAHNASHLCGGRLERFEVKVNGTDAPTRVTNVPLSDVQCVPAVYFPGVFCTVAVNQSVTDDVMNYIYVRSVFTDGTVTGWAYYQGLVPTVWVDPEIQFKLYDVPLGTTVQNPSVTQAMVQFSGASFRPSDLHAFCAEFGIPQPPVHVHGINNPDMVNFEPQLDMQMLAGVGRGAQLTAWITQPPAAVEGLIAWAAGVNNVTDIPMVFSISYGSPADITTSAQRSRLDYELMKLGLRGVTVMAATGDSGLQGGVNVSCTEFTTTVLATSPYITAVGGTALWTQGQQVGVQSDAGMYYTAAGGFSNYRPRPTFQQDAVATFLKTSTHLPPMSTFNATMRAIPDVSSIALNAWTVSGGQLQPTGGTSTASPSFSGVVTLLNDVRISHNMTTLGWLNPLLYQHPQAFYDVTEGNNRCSTWSQCCDYGFYAQKGWDPVSGLGTPLYSMWKDIVLATGRHESR